VVFAAFRYFNAFGAWMSVGFVAMSRCLSLLNWRVFKSYIGASGQSKRRSYLVLVVWLYGFCMILPSLLGASGKFGYNRFLGKCDFMSNTDDVKDNPNNFFYAIGFFLPFCILTASYYLIYRKSKSSSKYLKSLSHENKQQLESRDGRLTLMILSVSGCFVIFVGPIAMVNIIDHQVEAPKWHLGFFMVYWLQYTLNFIIYALRNEQYRKAYKYFIFMMLRRCFRFHHDPKASIFLLKANNQMLKPRQLQFQLRGLEEELDQPEIKDRGRVDIRVDYSLDNDKSRLSYQGTFEVDSGSPPAIIILPAKLAEVNLPDQQWFGGATNFKVNKTKKKKKGKVTFLSEGGTDSCSCSYISGDNYDCSKQTGRKLSYSYS